MCVCVCVCVCSNFFHYQSPERLQPSWELYLNQLSKTRPTFISGFREDSSALTLSRMRTCDARVYLKSSYLRFDTAEDNQAPRGEDPWERTLSIVFLHRARSQDRTRWRISPFAIVITFILRQSTHYVLHVHLNHSVRNDPCLDYTPPPP